MASKDLKYNLRIDAKDAQRALKDTAGDADDTRTKAQRLADALKKLAEDADAEFADMKSASGVMAEALGADFVQAAADAGRSTDQIVIGLQDMGLSFDDIRGDADRLADAVKRLDTTRAQVDGVGTAARNTAGDFDRVSERADNTRSVVANFSGNAIAELPGISGALGPLNMAIGQFGEYAAEGNIQLSKFVAAGLGIGAAAVAFKGISESAEKVKRINAFRAEEIEDYAKALQGADSELEAIVTKLRDAGEIKVAPLGDIFEVRDVTENMANLGLTVDQFALLVEGGEPKIQAYRKALEETGYAGEDLFPVILAASEQSRLFEEAAKNAAITAKVFGEEVAGAGKKVDNISGPMSAAKGYLDQLESGAKEAGAATKDLGEDYDALTGKLTDREAWLNLQTSIEDWYTGLGDATLGARDQELALIDLKKKLAEYGVELDGIDPEKKTEILALIDQGKIGEVYSMLEELTKPRTVSIRPVGVGGIRSYASGTSNHPGGLAIVGEEGPELVDLPRGSAVTPAGPTAAMLNGAGGGLTVIVNAQGAIGLNAADIERYLVSTLKKYGQRGGIV